jgi:CRISPR/Cas system-associated endonuclease Cas1
LKQFAADALAAPSIESLLGTEGAAAAEYFGQFAGMIKAEPELAQAAACSPPLTTV